MSELSTCAKPVGGLAVTTLPWCASRSFIWPCLRSYLYRSRSRISAWST